MHEGILMDTMCVCEYQLYSHTICRYTERLPCVLVLVGMQ